MVKIDFIKVLAELKPSIIAELERFLPAREPLAHYSMVRDYPARKGKALRPALVLLACETFGGNPAKAIRTAAALEAAHNWLLIHDDIEDHSDERRGKPTLHKIHGIELAINAGDALQVIQWKMLHENREVLGPELTFKVLDEVYNILLTTAEGQFIEISWVRDNKIDLTESDYYYVVDRKSGCYTIAGPMRLGAIIAGADKQTLAAISELGIPLGRAFQIQDDVLNLTATAAYGKEIAGDIWEGKRTLMLIHLLQHCTAEEKAKVAIIYSKRREQKTESEIKYILDLMRKYGSIEHAKRKSLGFVAEARQIFDRRFATLPDTKAKRCLRAMIEFVASREL